MEKIKQLIDVIDQLMGPEGCPWDQKQTTKSVIKDLIEEANEVKEAIEKQDHQNLEEELGDVLFVVLFLARLAEKEKLTTLDKVTSGIVEKLIRRHPHVFHEKKKLTEDEVLAQWKEIKKKEKGETNL